MNRRGFLKLTAGGIAAAIAAPYVITTPGLLMKVRATGIWLPSPVDAWLEDARKTIAESIAADMEHVLMYGNPMTATEVLARHAEGIARLSLMLNTPDRQWFTLKLKDETKTA